MGGKFLHVGQQVFFTHVHGWTSDVNDATPSIHLQFLAIRSYPPGKYVNFIAKAAKYLAS